MTFSSDTWQNVRVSPFPNVLFHKISNPIEGIGNFREEGGSQRPKTLKQCMKLNWNFQRGGGGGGGQRANPFRGGMEIKFAETTQCSLISGVEAVHEGDENYI